MNATLTDLVAGVQDLDSSNVSLAKTVVTLQESMSKANTDLATAQVNVTSLTMQVTTLMSTNTFLNGQLAGAQAQYNALLADRDSLAAQLAAAVASSVSRVDPFDVLTGKVAPTIFGSLQLHKRSPQVVGTTVNQDQEIMFQWGDAGGTKADSNPNTVVKPHGTAVWVSGTTAHLAFTPAAVGDNEFMFMPLPTPTDEPKYFYSSSTYQCTAAEAATLQCPERDSQIIWKGWVYNFGIQLNKSGWRFYQYSPSAWVPSPVLPMVGFVNSPVKFEVVSTIDTVAHTVTRLAIRINGGAWLPIGLTFAAFNTGTPTLNKLTVAIQADTIGAAAGAFPPSTGFSVLDLEERYL